MIRGAGWAAGQNSGGTAAVASMAFAGGDQVVGKEGALNVEELAFEFLGPAFGIVHAGAEFLDIDGEATVEGACRCQRSGRTQMGEPSPRKLGRERENREGRIVPIATAGVSFKERGMIGRLFCSDAAFFPSVSSGLSVVESGL
jgi:hypothetical protein